MDKDLNIEFKNYFDGIPPEVAERHANMTEEELDTEIEAEKKRCENAKSWDELM